MTTTATATTSTGLLATDAEMMSIRCMGASRNRAVRAAVLLATRMPLEDLVDAVRQLAPLDGAGRHLTVTFSANEIMMLDGLAANAATSRSRVMRAGIRLLANTPTATRVQLLDELPRDRRMRASVAHAGR